jgi:hypothetical protein
MSFRRALAFLSCVILVGCGGGGSGILGVAGSGNGATVRFFNATSTLLDLAVGGVVTPASSSLAPGTDVGCFTVSDPTQPGLSVRLSGSTTDLAGFAPALSAGGSFTVIAYPGPSGVVQFSTISNSAPSIGSLQSALRVFNGAPRLGSVDVFVTAPGAALGAASATGVGLGSVSPFFQTPAGVNQIRLTAIATTTVVFDVGSRTLNAGQAYTLVMAGESPIAYLLPAC